MFSNYTFEDILNNKCCFFLFVTRLSFDKILIKYKFSKDSILTIRDFFYDVVNIDYDVNSVKTYFYVFDVNDIYMNLVSFLSKKELFIKAVVINGYLINFFQDKFNYGFFDFLVFFFRVLVILIFVILYLILGIIYLLNNLLLKC